MKGIAISGDMRRSVAGAKGKNGSADILLFRRSAPIFGRSPAVGRRRARHSLPSRPQGDPMHYVRMPIEIESPEQLG